MYEECAKASRASIAVLVGAVQETCDPTCLAVSTVVTCNSSSRRGVAKRIPTDISPMSGDDDDDDDEEEG